MFNNNDYVVHPRAGVCRITDTTEMPLQIHGSKKQAVYYILQPLENVSEKIYLPAENAEGLIRNIMSREDALNILENFHSIPEIHIENEKNREQQYKAILKSGKPDELLGIIKQLYTKRINREKNKKPNNTTDEQYFRIMETRMYDELAIATGKENFHCIRSNPNGLNRSEHHPYLQNS